MRINASIIGSVVTSSASRAYGVWDLKNLELASRLNNWPSAPGTVYPSSYTGLQLWLDANDASTITTSGTTVTAWTNKSSVSKIIILGGSPQLITSALKGKNGVRFTTSDSVRDATNYAAPVTVMYVGRLTGGTNRRFITANGNNWLLGPYSGAENAAYFEGWVYSPTGGADTTARLWTATIGGGGVNSTVYVNTTSVAANQSGTTGPNGITINQSGFGETSDCELYELVVYNKVISTDERDNLFTYFSNKWL